MSCNADYSTMTKTNNTAINNPDNTLHIRKRMTVGISETKKKSLERY